ncbi:MAG: polysaccharide biosynthesis/export family protein, partial [Limisphaerales bacterium]
MEPVALDEFIFQVTVTLKKGVMKNCIRKFCQWPFLRNTIITLGILTAAGCSTTYYDPNNPSAAAAAQQDAFGAVGVQSSDSSQPQPTILRQGDVVKVSFPGSANLNETEQIRLDGKIALPLVGDVQAAGLTPDQLQQNLVKLYAPQISASDVTVAIESSSFPIYVTGCVLSPGRVLSNQPITALEAIMEAGGFDYSRANLRKVHVIRRENDTS